jgi:ribosomal protein S18 acetylase RimI-like enzyme
MRVRWADVGDVDELVRLRAVMYAGMDEPPDDDGWQALVAEQLRAGLPDGQYFAAVVDAPDGESGLASCGIGMVWHRLSGPGDHSGRLGYVMSMATDPRWRGRGYARAVFGRLMERFTVDGVPRVSLHASSCGLPLYRSFGFREHDYPELYSPKPGPGSTAVPRWAAR